MRPTRSDSAPRVYTGPLDVRGRGKECSESPRVRRAGRLGTLEPDHVGWRGGSGGPLRRSSRPWLALAAERQDVTQPEPRMRLRCEADLLEDPACDKASHRFARDAEQTSGLTAADEYLRGGVCVFMERPIGSVQSR